MHDPGDTLNLNIKIISIYISKRYLLTDRNKRIILSSLSPEPQFDLRRVSVGVVARSHVENIGHGDLFGPPEITAKSSASSVPTAKP